MRIELKIPRGWRRVRRGKVKGGDMISVISPGCNATVGKWITTEGRSLFSWTGAVGGFVKNLHCVIRRAT